MKWSEIFKKAGINLDDEIDNTDKSTLELNSDSNLKNNVEEKDMSSAFVEPKRDSKGLFDLSGVEDESLKNFLKKLNDEKKAELQAKKAEDDKRVVSEAISKYAKDKVKFSDGWSLDDALKLGDFSKVVNDDNLEKNIEDAFTNLKSTKANLFVKENSNSNPLFEGFNPQQSHNASQIPNSFMEAFSMQE